MGREAATAAPAKVLRLEGQVGTLRPGANGDVALFRVEEGEFELVDPRRVKRTAKTRLVNTLTLVGGRTLPPEAPNEPAPWIKRS